MWIWCKVERLHRVEGGRRIYRSIEDLGPGVIKINDGLWFVIGRRGVKEYDGRFLRRVVIISKVGIKFGRDHDVIWLS